MRNATDSTTPVPDRNCAICDQDVLPAGTLFDRPVTICRACRHITWLALPTPSETDDYYQKTYGSRHDQASLQASQAAYYDRHVKELLNYAGGTIEDVYLLDYGCSIPFFLARAKAAGIPRAVGVDWDPESFRWAERNQIQLFPPDVFHAAVPDSSLTILRFSHILEHAENPLTLLRRVLRKARRGALVYITQPSFPPLSLDVRLTELKDAVWPEHLHFFSPLSLATLAERCGVRIARFLTHQNAEEVFDRFRAHIDTDLVKARLASLAGLGRADSHRYERFPYYAGENSALFGYYEPLE